MKVHLELQPGFETGAVIGTLEQGIKAMDANVSILQKQPNLDPKAQEALNATIKAISVARRIIQNIEDAVHRNS